jgi:hypothetical protein
MFYFSICFFNYAVNSSDYYVLNVKKCSEL